MKLWKEKNDYTHFDSKTYDIYDTCRYGQFSIFIPYERLYETLNQDELLQLIIDAKTFRWQALDLSYCGLTSLPDELWDLPDLRILYLDYNLLYKKDNSDNNSIFIPRKIEQLQNLQVLSLVGNSIKFEDDIPLEMSKLIYLDIFDCGFSQIPKALLIPSIKEIFFNCLEEFLSKDFFNLRNLEKIYLNHSKIKKLPRRMDFFKNLQELYLWNTKITELPNSMSQLRYLSTLVLGSTPLAKKISPEILNQSAKEIVRYVLAQQSNLPENYFHESKMIIVEQSSVKKSNLLNHLVWDKHEEKDSTYLVAESLENKTINLDYEFPFKKTLSFRYEYNFIPAGIMTRFIVSLNDYLETIDNVKQCWKKGAYLKRNTAYALVRLYDNSSRYVDIKVSGEIPRDRQELLTIIRKSFEEIHSQFKQIKIAEKIPCICSEKCEFLFDYKTILFAESKGKRTIECHHTLEDVDIKNLLDGVEAKMENSYGNPIFVNNNHFSPHNQNNPKYNYSPQNNTTQNPTNTSTSTSSAETNVTTTITIDIRNTINGLHGDLNYLKKKTKGSSDEFDKKCEDVSSALKELDNYETKEDIIRSGELNTIRDFLLECSDPQSKTGKLLAGVKYAGGIVKELASKYNKIAKWVALPQIPFVGE